MFIDDEFVILIFSLFNFSAPGSTYDSSDARPRVDIDPLLQCLTCVI